MTTEKQQITDIVYSAINDLNDELGRSQFLVAEPETLLSRDSGGLDSLAIVSFEMMLDERIGTTFNQDLAVDINGFLDENGGAARSVQELIDHLLEQLNQERDPD
jgi:acyl carrier protein